MDLQLRKRTPLTMRYDQKVIKKIELNKMNCMNITTFTNELLEKFYAYIKLCESAKDTEKKRISGRLLRFSAEMFSEWNGEDIRNVMTAEVVEKCLFSNFSYIESLSDDKHLVFMDCICEEHENNEVIKLIYPMWNASTQKVERLTIAIKPKV